MSENRVMTFPNKKRMNTELFFGGNRGLYKQKERIKKLSDLFEEGELKRAEVGTNINN